jgi:dihydrolipoamide dehydrogenase
VRLNVGCIPSKALLRNADIAHLLRTDADTFGIEGATTMRYNAAFERFRQVAVERGRGMRFLMRKNNIDEYEGRGVWVDRHTMHIKGQDIDTQISFDAVIIATGAAPRLLPGTSREPRVRTTRNKPCPASCRRRSPSSERVRSASNSPMYWPIMASR